MYQRDNNIDYLRVLGTFLVMLAHVLPPVLIQNIRTFDVVMLVFISALSMNITYSSSISFKSYLLKRIKRLYVPTAILLLFVFSISFITCALSHRAQLFNLSTIIHSFLLLDDGLGYIWITRVYLVIAVFSYFVMQIRDKLPYIIFIFFLLCLAIIILPLFYGKSVAVDSYVIITCPYLLVSLIGILVANKKIDTRLILVVCAILVLAFSFYYGSFEPNSYKYPPSFYYLAYGLFCTLILRRVILPYSRTIEWLSKNSFNIYLIHIPILLSLSFLSEYYNVFDIWYIKYIVVCLLSVAIPYVYGNLKNKIYEYYKKTTDS